MAELLSVPADQLLSQALGYLDPEKHKEVLVDLRRLPDSPAGRQMARYAHHIRSMRGDFLSSIVTLRAGDLGVIARSSGVPVRRLLSDLGGAVRRVGPSDSSPRSLRVTDPRSATPRDPTSS